MATIFELQPVESLVWILFGALTGLLFIFSSDILGRYLKADKQQRGDAVHMTFFVMGISILGYGTYMVTKIVGAYIQLDWISTFSMLILTLVLTAFALTAEQFVFPKRSRFMRFGQFRMGLVGLLAIAAIVVMFVVTVIDVIDPADNFMANLSPFVNISIIIIGGFLGLVAFYGFIQILVIRLSPPKEIKRKILLGLCAGVFGLGGYIVSMFGVGSLIFLLPLGVLVEIIGWIFFRYFFLSIPSYSEIDWKNGIIELHVIMADTGLSLFHKVFRRVNPEALKGDLEVTVTIPEAARPDSDLTGGAMIGIKGLLSEIAGTKGKLRNILIGEKNLVFNQANYAMVLLLADQNLGVYHSILYKLVREIEDENPSIANFDGNLKKLHIEPIIDRFFGTIKPAEKNVTSEIKNASKK